MNNLSTLKAQISTNEFNTTNNSKRWLKIANSRGGLFINEEVTNICKKFEQQKRWILCINGNDKDVKHLAENIDSSKLLRVNGNNNDVSFEKIKRVLSKGNCSTVVLCQSDYDYEHLMVLQHCAQLGNTQCIVINKPMNTLH